MSQIQPGAATRSFGARPAIEGASASRAIFILFLAFIAWVPFWFGSNRPLAWHVNAAAAGALVLADIAAALAGGDVRSLVMDSVRVRFSIMLFGLAATWTALQATPGLFGDAASPWWPLASDILGRALPETISVAPAVTLVGLERLVTDAAAFWLGLRLARGQARSTAMLATLAASGAAYALYGLLALASGEASVLWIAKAGYVHDATGPFVNRNSFALYAGIASFAALELGVRFARDRSKWRAALASTALVVLLAAAAMSHSRAALLIDVLSLFALGVARVATIARSKALLALNLAMGAALLACALMVASLFVAGRMANLDEDAQTLFAAYRLTWNAIVERPLTGHVYGTFELMFPPIRDLSVSGSQTWNYAHNAYLETMAGLGVPAALTLMLSFLAPLLTCAGAILRPRRDLGATRVAVAAFLALGLHSLVDFSIQMQAISIAAFALLGAGLARTA